MPAKRLTDAFLRNVRLPNPSKGERQVTYLDTIERGLALILVVSYGGSKTFRVMTYRNGKARTLKLGTYPQMSVKAARDKARAYFQNPEKFDAQASVGSFKDVARAGSSATSKKINFAQKQKSDANLKGTSIRDGKTASSLRSAGAKSTICSIRSPIVMGVRKPMQYWQRFGRL